MRSGPFEGSAIVKPPALPGDTYSVNRCRRQDAKLDLNVLEKEEGRVTTFRENPVAKFYASMGMYCMEHPILNLIPKGVPFGFDDLIRTMLDQDLPAYTYRHEGLWIDIGRQEEFAMAQEIFQNGRGLSLGR